MSASTASTAPAFSYAQAARNASTTTPTPTVAPSVAAPNPGLLVNSSKAASTTSIQSRDSGADPSSTSRSESLSISVPESDATDSLRMSSVPSDATGKSQEPDTSLSTTSEVAPTESIPLNAKTSNASYPVELEAAQSPSSTPAGDKRGKLPSPNSRASENVDSKKPRRGKKQKASDKDQEQEKANETDSEQLPQLPELAEAPIPSVNPWLKRQEERNAKTTPSVVATAPTAGVISDGALVNTTKISDAKGLENSQGFLAHSSTTESKATKKLGETNQNSGDQPSRRAAPRGGRITEKNEKGTTEAIPPVADAALWPTPDTAAVEPKNGDKIEKSEKTEKEEKEELVQPKSRDKKWEKMEFTPTVSFNTPIPRGGSRGGRHNGTRGGRESTPRSPHGNASSSAGDRSQALSSSSRLTQGPHDRANDEKARPLPQPNSRPSSDAASRKSSVPASTNGRKPSSAERVSESRQDPDSLKSHQTGPENEATIEDKSLHNGTDGQQPMTEPGRRSSDSSKENVSQNGKDAAYQGYQRNRGGNKGRGGHSGSNGHLPQQHHHHGPPNFPGSGLQPFVNQPNGAFRMNNFMYPPVQFGSPFYNPAPPNSSRYHQRTSPSPSSSGSAVGRPPLNGARNSSRAPQNQPGHYSYDAGLPVPMLGTAPPLVEANHNVLSLVMSQVNYYFSVDNLCKDTYMRSRMDSQGFVLLSFIAEFKRMKSLTNDYSAVIRACDISDQVEIVVGEDGRERVRAAHDWHTWVLPFEGRDPSARHNGPQSVRPLSHYRVMQPPYPMAGGSFSADSSTTFSPTHMDASFGGFPNGASQADADLSNGSHGHHSGISRHFSVDAPVFSPASGYNLGALEDSTPFTVESEAKSAGLPVNGNGQTTAAGDLSANLEQSSFEERPATNGLGIDGHPASSH